MCFGKHFHLRDNIANEKLVMFLDLTIRYDVDIER